MPDVVEQKSHDEMPSEKPRASLDKGTTRTNWQLLVGSRAIDHDAASTRGVDS